MFRMALLCVIMAQAALAGGPPTPAPPPSCEARQEANKRVIEACKALVVAQDASIEHLKASVKDLNSRIEAQKEPQFLDFVPPWAWIMVGGVAGVAIGSRLK